MAEIIWSEPASVALDGIADYIAFDNPMAAKRLVQKITTKVEHLARFSKLGSRIPEAPRESARQLVIKPCRVFYRIKRNKVIVVNMVRNEMQFHLKFLT
jgi:toxin ParE1/3/4